MTEGIAPSGRLTLPGAQTGSQGRKENLPDSQAFANAVQTKVSVRQKGDFVAEQEPGGRAPRLAELLEKLSFAAQDDGAPAEGEESQLAIQAPVEEHKTEGLDSSLPVAEGEKPPVEAQAEAKTNEPAIKDQAMPDSVPAETTVDAEKLMHRHPPPAAERNPRPPLTAGTDRQTVVEPALRQPGPEQANTAKPQQSTVQTGGSSMPERAQPHGRATGTVASQDSGLREKNFGDQGQDNNGGKQPFRVIGLQSAPSPVAALPTARLSSTGTALAGALAADPGFSGAAAEAARSTATGQMQTTKPLHTLKIQLHPAQLGTVTARLSISGEQLKVELSVGSNEARQRLGADSEAMTRALRALGYDVDRITIQQPPQTSNAGANANPAGRDGSGFAADGGDGRHGNDTGARSGGGGDTGQGRQGRAEEDSDAPARDSLYI